MRMPFTGASKDDKGGDARTPAKAAEPVIEDKAAAMGSLDYDQRLASMIYLLGKAREAGNKGDGPFDVEAARKALVTGKLRLSGTREQIGAQLLLAHAMAVVVERALDYDVTAVVDHDLDLTAKRSAPRPLPIRKPGEAS